MSEAFATGGPINDKTAAFLGTPASPTDKGRAYVHWKRFVNQSDDAMDAFSAGWDSALEATYLEAKKIVTRVCRDDTANYYGEVHELIQAALDDRLAVLDGNGGDTE